MYVKALITTQYTTGIYNESNIDQYAVLFSTYKACIYTSCPGAIHTLDAFHLVTQFDTSIVLFLLFIECQER